MSSLNRIGVAVIVAAFSAVGGCSKSDGGGAGEGTTEVEPELPRYRYDLTFWLAVPLGATLVLAGEEVGVIQPVDGMHKATIEVPDGVTLASEPGPLIARIDSPCGPFDLPLVVDTKAEFVPDETYRSESQVFKGLTMRPSPAAQARMNVWVDRKGAEGKTLTIGEMTLTPPPANPTPGERDAGAAEAGEPEERHTLHNFACDKGRAVAVDGVVIGELPEEVATWPADRSLPDRHKYQLVSMTPGVCYTSTKVSYGVVGDPPKTTRLQGGQVLALPGWIDRFMEPAPKEVTVKTNDVIALASVRDLVRTRCKRR